MDGYYKAVCWVARQRWKTIVPLLRSVHRAAQVWLSLTLILRGGTLQWDAIRSTAINSTPPQLSLQKQSGLDSLCPCPKTFVKMRFSLGSKHWPQCHPSSANSLCRQTIPSPPINLIKTQFPLRLIFILCKWALSLACTKPLRSVPQHSINQVCT